MFQRSGKCGQRSQNVGKCVLVLSVLSTITPIYFYGHLYLASVGGPGLGPKTSYTTAPKGSRICIASFSSKIDYSNSTEPKAQVVVVTFRSSHTARVGARGRLIVEARPIEKGYENWLYSLRRFGYRIISRSHNSMTASNHRMDMLRRLEQTVSLCGRQPPKQVILIANSLTGIMTVSPSQLITRFRRLGFPVIATAPICRTSACKPDQLDADHIMGEAHVLHSLFTATLIRMRTSAKLTLDEAFTAACREKDGLVGRDFDMTVFGILTPAARNRFDAEGGFQGNGSVAVSRFLQRASGTSPAMFFFGESGTLCDASAREAYDMIGKSILETESQSPVGGKPRVVISLTTTPQRIVDLRPVLKSLVAQTFPVAAIYLNVPYVSVRFNVTYKIPPELAEFPIKINRCEDFGPATKLIPTLQQEKDPNTLLITVDDEYVYPASLVEDLVRHISRWPHAAYNYAGQVVEVDEQSGELAVRSADIAPWDGIAAVDILEAFLGAIYKRSFFGDSISDIPPRCWTTDDVWISHHLASRGIPRIRMPMPHAYPQVTRNDLIAPLRANNIGGDNHNTGCVSELLSVFQRGWSRTIRACPIAFQPISRVVRLKQSQSYWPVCVR